MYKIQAYAAWTPIGGLYYTTWGSLQALERKEKREEKLCEQ